MYLTLSKFRESGFVKNVITLMTGTVLAQMVNILGLPFLARVYDPIYFGYLGSFFAVSSILVTISNLQFSKAIILGVDIFESQVLVVISMILVSILALFCMVITQLDWIIINLSNKMTIPKIWILLFPFYLWLSGAKEILYVWNNRIKRYKTIAFTRFIIALLSVVGGLTIGLLGGIMNGLIFGYMLGNLFGITFLILDLKFSKESFWSKKIINKRNVTLVAAKYVNFPKFTLPSELMNVFINQIPIFALGLYGSQTFVGYFTMSNKILGLPLTFISGAIGEVFKQKSSAIYLKSGQCEKLYKNTFFSLGIISLVPFFVIIFFAPFFFVLILGDEWQMAGTIAQIMSPMFLFRFFSSPLSFLYHLASKQKEELLLHVYFLLSSVIIFYCFISQNILLTLAIFSLNYVCIYIVVLYRSFIFSKLK